MDRLKRRALLRHRQRCGRQLAPKENPTKHEFVWTSGTLHRHAWPLNARQWNNHKGRKKAARRARRDLDAESIEAVRF